MIHDRQDYLSYIVLFQITPPAASSHKMLLLMADGVSLVRAIVGIVVLDGRLAEVLLHDRGRVAGRISPVAGSGAAQLLV